MTRRTPSDLILVGLGALVVAQVGLLGYRALRPAIAAQDRLAVGDVIGEVATTAVDGERIHLTGDASEQTLIMVFHSQCAWCREIAPAWSDWLADRPEGLRVLAVSNEPAEIAKAYADEMRWDVDVASVTVREPGDAAHSLTSRTPWLLLLDEQGVVRFEGQGRGLDALDAALARDETVYSSEEDK